MSVTHGTQTAPTNRVPTGNTPESPISAPDLTYTRKRKELQQEPSPDISLSSSQKNDVSSLTAATLVLSSPQAVLSPGGTLSLLFTVKNTGTAPLSGIVLELCCDNTILQLMQGTAWMFMQNVPPTLLVPRADEGILFDLPATVETNQTVYMVLTLCMRECDFPKQITLSGILYADRMQAVSSETLTFPVCCANLETRKECIRGSSADRATFRIILTNSGTGSACNITVEDRLPDGFYVDHVLYGGFELAENVQYTVVGTMIRVFLPTCIRPQTAGELSVIGHFETSDNKK